MEKRKKSLGRKYFELNDNENTMYRYLWDAPKMLRKETYNFKCLYSNRRKILEKQNGGVEGCL